MPQLDTLHLFAVILVLLDEVRRHDTVLDHLTVVVDVVKEGVERRHPLDRPPFDLVPILGGEHPGDHVEGQNTVDRAAVLIEREGDAEIVEFLLDGLGPLFQRAQAHLAEPFDERCQRPVPSGVSAGNLAKKIVRIIPGKNALKRHRPSSPPKATFGLTMRTMIRVN